MEASILYQRKAWKTKQCGMTRSQSLSEAQERAIYEAVRVKPGLLWRFQEVGAVRNVECLPRKVVSSEVNPVERPCQLKPEGHRGGLVHATWSIYFTTIFPES